MIRVKYHVKYFTGPDADSAALEDAKSYLGEKRWGILVDALGNDEVRFQTLLFLIEMSGIRGYPMWAILRKYRLAQYCTWCREEGVPVGDDGFPLDLTKAEIVDAVIEKGDHTSH